MRGHALTVALRRTIAALALALSLTGCASLTRAADVVRSYADVEAALSCVRAHGFSAELAACLGVEVVAPGLRQALDAADERLNEYLAARAGAGAEADLDALEAEANAAIVRLEQELAAAR